MRKSHTFRRITAGYSGANNAVILLISFGVTAGIGAIVEAKEPPRDRVPRRGLSTRRGLAEIPLLFRSGEIMRTPVVNTKGHELGQIEELVIDAREGTVRYAALEFKSALGQQKLFAVPWNSLNLQRGRDGLSLVFDVTRNQLHKAPGFSRTRWPNVANRKWAETIDIYYGVVVKRGDLKSSFGRKVRPVSAIPHLMRSEKLRGIEVKDPTGRTVGRLDELVVDLNRSGTRYATITLKGVGVQGKLLPVPFNALEFKTETSSDPHFILRLKHVLLGRAPLFDMDDWPELRNPRWSSGIDRYFGVNWNAPERSKSDQSEKPNSSESKIR